VCVILQLKRNREKEKGTEGRYRKKETERKTKNGRMIGFLDFPVGFVTWSTIH
jgi:hypothetical protein